MAGDICSASNPEISTIQRATAHSRRGQFARAPGEADMAVVVRVTWRARTATSFNVVGFGSMEISHRETAPDTVVVTIAGSVMMGSESEQITTLVSDLLGKEIASSYSILLGHED